MICKHVTTRWVYSTHGSFMVGPEIHLQNDSCQLQRQQGFNTARNFINLGCRCCLCAVCLCDHVAEHLAAGYLIAGLDTQAAEDSSAWCVDGVEQLHGRQLQDGIAFGNLVAVLRKDL